MYVGISYFDNGKSAILINERVIISKVLFEFTVLILVRLCLDVIDECLKRHDYDNLNVDYYNLNVVCSDCSTCGVYGNKCRK